MLGITERKAADIGVLNPFRYRGYYYDAETGMYYLKSRYYDPEMRRFVNPDSGISGVGGNMRGYNMYSYCFNNPVDMLEAQPEVEYKQFVQKHREELLLVGRRSNSRYSYYRWA